jgi:hypothetical protein
MREEELEVRNVKALGEAFGKQYTALFSEVGMLHLYWKEFLELFGTSDKRIERLNRSAPSFFSMLQGQQFASTVLLVARLTDPPKSAGKENLTIQNLPLLVKDATLKGELERLVDDAIQKAQFCRDWRNRQYAHADLALATRDTKASPLPAAPKEKIKDVLAALSDVVNAIERLYFKSGCSLDSITTHEGAATLLYVLGFGVKARDKMQHQIKSEKFDELDPPENI